MTEIDRETCECTELHMDAIQRARSAMSSPEQVDKLAELFKVLSDPTRVRILQALHCQRLCVCDIAETLGMTQSAISHQLRILKQNHLIKYRREGKNMIYALADDHVKTIINCAIEHIEE